MKNPTDINQYKLAKTLTSDIMVIIPKMVTALNELRPHTKYAAVQAVVNSLEENLMVLNVHLRYQKDILENKDENGPPTR